MKFTWKGITFAVGCMNRAEALACVAEFNKLIGAGGDLRQADIDDYVACHVPVVIQNGSDAFASGTHELTQDDGLKLTVTLPMSRQAFQALPMTLTNQWIEAATVENNWLTVDLKKEDSLTTTSGNEPQSGNTPS